MKIEKVIQPGECVSKSEMVKLLGGFDMMDNDNKAVITCFCSVTADNSNKGLWCSCDGEKTKTHSTDTQAWRYSEAYFR